MSRLYRYFIAASWQTVAGNMGVSEVIVPVSDAPLQTNEDLEPVRQMIKSQMEDRHGVEIAWLRLTAVNYLPSPEDLSR